MKLSDNEVNWLRFIDDRPAWLPDRSTSYVRRRCRELGLTFYDKHHDVWMLTSFGRAALNEAGRQSLKEQGETP